MSNRNDIISRSLDRVGVSDVNRGDRNALLSALVDVMAKGVISLPVDQVFSTVQDRDAFFTANPSRLVEGSECVIKQTSQDGIYQRYVTLPGDPIAWVDYGSLVIGPPGSGTDFSHIKEGNIPAIGGAPNYTPYDSGLQVLPNGNMLAPKNFGVESGSIDFGDTNTLSESGGYLANHNHINGKLYTVVDFESNFNSVSKDPEIFALTESEGYFTIQGTNSSTITQDAITGSYTTTFTARANGVTFDFASTCTDFRFIMTDASSGVVLRYYPDKSSWLASEGVDITTTGQVSVRFDDSPIPVESGTLVNYEIRATGLSMKGDSSGTPWLRILGQRGELRIIPSDRTLTEGNIRVSTKSEESRIISTSGDVSASSLDMVHSVRLTPSDQRYVTMPQILSSDVSALNTSQVRSGYEWTFANQRAINSNKNIVLSGFNNDHKFLVWSTDPSQPTTADTITLVSGEWVRLCAMKFGNNDLRYVVVAKGRLSDDSVGTTLGRLAWDAQVIQDSTNTVVNFSLDDIYFDLRGNDTQISYNPTNKRFINEAGRDIAVSLTYQLYFPPSATGVRLAWWEFSGISFKRVGYLTKNGDGEIGNVLCGTITMGMQSGDGFWLKCWQNSGQAMTINGGGTLGLLPHYSGRMWLTRIY